MAAIFNYCSRKSSKILICGLLGLSLSAVKVSAEDNILVIHSYDSELSSTKQEQEGIEQGFAEISNHSKVFHEYLDSKSYPTAANGTKFIDYINQKYRKIPLNLLMVVDDPSLDLVLCKHQEFFPNIPVVFLGIENLRQELLDTPWLTGVVEDYSIVETVKEATRQTWNNRVIIINDTTESGLAHLEQIEAVKSFPDKPWQIELVNDLAVKDIKSRLGRYPDNLPVIVLGQLWSNDSPRTLIDQRLDTKLLQKQIPNPIYTNSSVRLGSRRSRW